MNSYSSLTDFFPIEIVEKNAVKRKICLNTNVLIIIYSFYMRKNLKIS